MLVISHPPPPLPRLKIQDPSNTRTDHHHHHAHTTSNLKPLSPNPSIVLVVVFRRPPSPY